jgi:hypothetical protein
MADRTLAYLRKAFNWYAARDDQFNVPVVRGMARIKPKERARTRVLSDTKSASSGRSSARLEHSAYWSRP